MYRAPVNEIGHCIRSVSGFASEMEKRHFGDLSADLLDAVLEEAGKFANVTVYDQSGRTVAELANGASLSTSGFMRWDGTNRSGQQVRSGYYLVVFEVYDGAGSKTVLKETVVVGWE